MRGSDGGFTLGIIKVENRSLLGAPSSGEAAQAHGTLEGTNQVGGAACVTEQPIRSLLSTSLPYWSVRRLLKARF